MERDDPKLFKKISDYLAWVKQPKAGLSSEEKYEFNVNHTNECIKSIELTPLNTGYIEEYEKARRTLIPTSSSSSSSSPSSSLLSHNSSLTDSSDNDTLKRIEVSIDIHNADIDNNNLQ